VCDVRVLGKEGHDTAIFQLSRCFSEAGTCRGAGRRVDDRLCMSGVMLGGVAVSFVYIR
jgi:hypothetical protein